MRGAKTATPKGATTQPKPAHSPCSCGCQGGSGGCTCGQAVCFERPNFFGGQLLSDADLSAGQTYVREKHKLYHRALHGRGVVCGLRLTCDPDCCGHIRVGDGYAIDNCGNDIVVCQPASFDVIAALKAKNWLITDSPADPCDEEKAEPRCKVKQCFYVTICYDEAQAAFTTPFQTNCGPGAAACEPTRVKETFRFDVLEGPPKPKNFLHDLEKDIASCWSVFTHGPLARALQTHFGKDWTREAEKDYCGIFCQLQVLFKQYLQRYPDEYDCTLFEQVGSLECPPKDGRTWEGANKSFCELFQLMIRYVYNCVLGKMIFACPNPPTACCVGLGVVEVEDCKVLRVCNCPRSYVWTFANFFEVLLATIVGGAACASHGAEAVKKESQRPVESASTPQGEAERKEGGCCASILINCDQFLTLLREQPHFGRLAAAAPIEAIRRVVESLKTGFNFTDPLAFSPRVFEGLSAAQAAELAAKLAGDRKGVFQSFVDPNYFEAADPVAAVLGRMLKRQGDDLATVATSAEAKVAAVVPQSQVRGPSFQSAEIDGRIKAAEDKAAAAQASADTLTRQVKELTDLVNGLKEQLKSSPAAPPATPPAAPLR